MFKKLFAGIVLALGLSAQGAYSSTINQEVDITYLGGSYAGQTISLSYSYPSLPAGQDIWSYSPAAVTGSVSFLDASTSNLTSAQLVFSGSGDIMQPEPYLSFLFDATANSLGLLNFEVWNIGHFGFYTVGAPDILTLSCGRDVSCAYRSSESPANVPLPMSLAFLGLALMSLASIAVFRRRRSALVPQGVGG